MDPKHIATASEAHPETMDFLSHAWCNFAVQAFSPHEEKHAAGMDNKSIVLRDIPPPPKQQFSIQQQSTIPIMEKSMKMDDGQDRSSSMPNWQSSDLKSWIMMQQAMHPELNYNSCFKKKWFSWKVPPIKNNSIRKWVKEIKEKRKEEKRLQKAEVHAALSIAGLAAALAAVAAERPTTTMNHHHHHHHNNRSELARDEALASAASLVAAQCAQMAELMGAKRNQISEIIGSAMSGTSTSDILTLTAAATSSLRGAATLKARTGCINRMMNGGTVAPILPPLEDDDDDTASHQFDFEKSKLVLAKGAQLTIETSDGRCLVRMVSLHLNNEAKVILKIKKLNMLNIITSKKECMVLDQYAELYKGNDGDDNDTCFQIVVTTSRGLIKLDMEDDYQRYKMWTSTIHHMLMLSSSITKYELRFSNN